MSSTITARVAALDSPALLQAITAIRRGIERETLRILPDGQLSQRDHALALGSALTHPLITTDFSEALLEFITPAQSSIETTLAQLSDIHKFALSQINDELLGAGSMPCKIAHQDEIRLANYGSSHLGTMKTLYRQGLKNRYGSMMQAISGVHFNFSLPHEFWQHYQSLVQHDPAYANQDTFAGQHAPSGDLQDFISAQYLALIRNYKRYVWLIVYLFGASPAMCKSFLEGRRSRYPFVELGQGSLYLPYATSLRMSDLGYTNNAQSALNISYNNLPDYIAGLQQAISTPSPLYQAIGVHVNGQYQQLNDHILQIENEFYSTIRPKRTTQSGERPTCALAKRGIEYIEVRALDVNPFSPVGITASQMRFLDIFLLYCVLKPSPDLSAAEQAITEQNLQKVVTDGRRQNLELQDGAYGRLMQDWAEELFAEFTPIAQFFDKAHGGDHYVKTLHHYYMALLDPSQTLSGQWLQQLLATRSEQNCLNMQLSQQHSAWFKTQPYQYYQQDTFEQLAVESLQAQQRIEAADQGSFAEYLAAYFAPNPCDEHLA